MFTGIIEEMGRVNRIERRGYGAEITIACTTVIEDVHIGDSIAVNGTCLTVVRFNETSFTADAVQETLSRTTIGAIIPGVRVNLERAVPADGRLGGHIVQGHVDCTGVIRTVVKQQTGYLIQIEIPPEHLRYVVEKGSVALDGISLTVAALQSDTFTCAVIPHTFVATTLHTRKSGERLNVECDILGKYVERLMGLQHEKGGGLTEAMMRNMGY